MASDETIEVGAPSVDEAVIIGLTRLAALRTEVEIEVLDEGNRGFLGLGNREARVRLTRRPEGAVSEPVEAPSEDPAVLPTTEEVPLNAAPVAEAAPVPEAEAPARDAQLNTSSPSGPAPKDGGRRRRARPARSDRRPRDGGGQNRPRGRREQDRERGGADLDRAAIETVARDVMVNLLPGMTLEVAVEWVDEDRPTLWVAVTGRDANALVGPRARNLQSLQYLFRALIYKQVDGNYNVVVDADGYRRRRRRSLESMARRKADEAVEKGEAVKLRAMPAHERRIIHILLKQDGRVSTESSGKGRDRAITIIPVDGAGRDA